MAYRKLSFGNNTYEYTIGRTALKIKGFPIVRLNDDDPGAITPSRVRSEIEKKLKRVSI